MLLGPVFRAELLRTARRPRYYVLRVLYGLALLLLVWINYQIMMDMARFRGGLVWISEVATFALNTFLTFAAVQVVTLLFLVPALFGGVIADEKQRKTMHYLMASRLSGAEIVLDKFLARMLHVGVFVLLGIPVMSLLSLFGGVPWEYVAVAYSGTAVITFFTAAMATLVSTFARRVRQGVVVSYMMLLLWLIVPPAAVALCRVVYPSVYVWIEPANEWLLGMNPIWVVLSRARLRGFPAWFAPAGFLSWTIPGGVATLFEPFLWMLALQVAAGVGMLAIAVLQLRPTARRQETSTRRLSWFKPTRPRPRWLIRPDCGGDAMLWKERYFARTDVFTKLAVLPATILLTVCVFLGGGFDESIVDAFWELVQQGYTGNFASRARVITTLRAISPLYIGLWLLAVAGASASSLTVEREEDTWTSLVSTPLSGWEILRGKIVGAIWGLRGFGGLLSLFWLAALVLGAVHPLGLLLALIIVAVLTWAVAAIGVHESLRARSTSRALTSTLLLLVTLNGGYLLVADPLLRIYGFRGGYEIVYFGCTPYLASMGLLSYGQVAWLGGAEVPGLPGPDPWGLIARQWIYRTAAFGVLVVAAYALAGVWLTQRSIWRFDAAVDRPKRPLEAVPHLEPEDSSRPVMVNAAQ